MRNRGREPTFATRNRTTSRTTQRARIRHGNEAGELYRKHPSRQHPWPAIQHIRVRTRSSNPARATMRETTCARSDSSNAAAGANPAKAWPRLQRDAAEKAPQAARRATPPGSSCDAPQQQARRCLAHQAARQRAPSTRTRSFPALDARARPGDRSTGPHACRHQARTLPSSKAPKTATRPNRPGQRDTSAQHRTQRYRHSPQYAPSPIPRKKTAAAKAARARNQCRRTADARAAQPPAPGAKVPSPPAPFTRSNHHPSRKRHIVPCARASVVINRSTHDVGQQRRPRILPRRKREPHAHTLWSANRPLVAARCMHRHVKRTTRSEKRLLSSGKRCSILKQHPHGTRRQCRRKLSQRAAIFHQSQLFQTRIIGRNQAQHLHLGSPHARKHTFTSISNGSLGRRQPRRLGNAGGRHASVKTHLAVAQRATPRLALQTPWPSPYSSHKSATHVQTSTPSRRTAHRPLWQRLSIRHRLTHGRQQHHIICIHSIHAHHSIAHPIAHLYHAKDSQQLFRATKKGRPSGQAPMRISLPRASESYSPSRHASTFRRSNRASHAAAVSMPKPARSLRRRRQLVGLLAAANVDRRRHIGHRLFRQYRACAL